MHIEQLEYEVWRLRGEVNRLRASAPGMEQQIDQERLQQLESELNYMGREVLRMKSSCAGAYPLSARDLMPGQSTVTTTGRFDTPLLAHDQPSAQNAEPPHPSPAERPERASRKKIDFEKAFGTGIMGIIASVLIFVSIIIFGSLIVPFLSKGMMAALMFLISFALSGAGLLLLQKNPTNKFYLSLCACGVTAACVSLFVTRILFGLIGNILFLALMCAWMAAMAYLCRQYHYLFRIIGEIGMLMASVVGIAQIAFSEDFVSYAVLLVVCGGSFAMYHFMNPRESYPKSAASHVIHTIALSAFSSFLHTADWGGLELAFACALSIGLLALLFFLSWEEDVKGGTLYYFLTTLQVAVTGMGLSAVNSETFSLFFLASAVFLVYCFSRKSCERYAFGEACASGLYLLGSIATVLSFEIGTFLAVICVVPLFLYGFLKDRRVFLYAALLGEVLCAVLLSSWFIGIDWSIEAFLLASAVPLAVFLCVARKVDGRFRSAGYFISMLCFAAGASALCGERCEFPLSEALSFLMLAAVHLAVIKGKILEDDSAPFEASYSAITLLLMGFGCNILNRNSEPGLSGALTFFVILALFALFSINSIRLLKKSEHYGYYVAAKYTALMLLTLDQICSIGIVFSVCLLLFALASIIGGFRFRHKSFRIYGLLLSMISVFKLILFDIEGKSMAAGALGFLTCGIICFVISFVYSKIEHRWREIENNQEA